MHMALMLSFFDNINLGRCPLDEFDNTETEGDNQKDGDEEWEKKEDDNDEENHQEGLEITIASGLNVLIILVQASLRFLFGKEGFLHPASETVPTVGYFFTTIVKSLINFVSCFLQFTAGVNSFSTGAVWGTFSFRATLTISVT